MTARINSGFRCFCRCLGARRRPCWAAWAGDEPKKEPVKETAKDAVKEAKKESTKDDKFELVIPGQILNNDPVDKVQRVPGKVHAVKMLKGKAYVIDLVSMDFDSYLRLEDSAGNQLAADDDGGGMLNSRIRFTASKDDTYLIYARRSAAARQPRCP